MLEMIRTLRQKVPGFGLLISGQLISMLGDRAASLAVAWVVLDLTHSTAAMGTITALGILPTVLLLPVTGWVSDNTPRLTVMALTDLVRAAAVGVITWMAFTHRLSLTGLEVMVILLGAGSAFFMPASSAFKADLLPPDMRVSGNAVANSLFQLPSLLGPFMGAALLALGGSAAAFGIDSASYLVSLLTLVGLARFVVCRPGAGGVPEGPRPQREPFLRQVVGGVRFVAASPWLGITILFFSVINIFMLGAMTVLLPWLVKERLGLGAGSLAVITVAGGLGAMAGGLLIGRMGPLNRKAWWAYGAIILYGLCILPMPYVGLPALAILSAVSGAGSVTFGIIWETSLQEMVPPELFGRVVSLDMLGSFGLSPIGVLVVGWAAQAAGPVPTTVAMGVLTILFAAAALLVPGVRRYN